MAYHKLQSGDFMVCGVLPADAELKTVGQNNSSKTTFSVKASEVTDAEGKKKANWSNCVAWHDAARNCAGFKKGDIVLVIGTIKTREYEGKTYRDLEVLFAQKMGTTPEPVQAQAQATVNPANVDLSEFDVLISDGDLPF